MNDPKRRHHLHHRFPPPAFSPPPPSSSSSSSSSSSALRFPPSSSSSSSSSSYPPLARPSHHLLPLSPHDSNSTTLSDSSTSSASGDLHRLFPSPDTCAQSRAFHSPHAASLFGPPNGCHHPAVASSPRISHIHGFFSSSGRTGNGVPNGVSFSDLPIVRGPVSSQPPRQTQIMDDVRPTAGDQESKRLKLVLEDLERELLGDDDDPAVATTGAPAADACSLQFTMGQQNASSAQAAREPRDWTDVIEDLLQASDAATALDQTSNITSICSNPNSSCGEDGFVSAAESSSPTTTLDHSTVTTVCSSKLPLSPATGVHPRELLLACANAINKEDYSCAEGFLSSLQQSSSIYGDPCQRLAVYMAAALEARIEKMTGRRQTKLLATPPPPTPEAISRGKQLLYKWCPYMKFGFLAANQAILEALEGERSLHIVDFSICSNGADQWLLLLEVLSRRGGALPRVRITGVVGAAAGGARQAEAVGRAVCEHGRRVGVGVEFGWVVATAAEDGGEAAIAAVQRRAGEALAVNWLFYLHGVADESVSERNPRDALLRGVVRRMRPRIVALVEHDANTNTPPFYQRFLHSLTYFTALFESLDGKSMRDNKERVNAEQQCLGRDMIDIVACEGAERRRRYDVAGKWRARMAMAGMGIVPLRAGEEVRALLGAYSPKYTLREEEGMLRLGWGGTPLVAASAWRPQPGAAAIS